MIVWYIAFVVCAYACARIGDKKTWIFAVIKKQTPPSGQAFHPYVTSSNDSIISTWYRKCTDDTNISMENYFSPQSNRFSFQIVLFGLASKKKSKVKQKEI